LIKVGEISKCSDDVGVVRALGFFDNFNDLLKIGKTFVWFLLFFGIELLVVFVYYQITNKIAGKRFKEEKPK